MADFPIGFVLLMKRLKQALVAWHTGLAHRSRCIVNCLKRREAVKLAKTLSEHELRQRGTLDSKSYRRFAITKGSVRLRDPFVPLKTPHQQVLAHNTKRREVVVLSGAAIVWSNSTRQLFHARMLSRCAKLLPEALAQSLAPL